MTFLSHGMLVHPTEPITTSGLGPREVSDMRLDYGLHKAAPSFRGNPTIAVASGNRGFEAYGTIWHNQIAQSVKLLG